MLSWLLRDYAKGLISKIPWIMRGKVTVKRMQKGIIGYSTALNALPLERDP